jgi:quercetin dioxygenase-like cupin family protein
MMMRISLGTSALAAGLALAPAALAQAPLIHQVLPYVPQMAVTMATVDLPPAGAGPVTTAGQAGHRHPAAVYAYVAKGAVISRLGDEPERRYDAGEAWSETPLQPHYIVNASKTEPARLVVVLVSKADTKTLTEALPKVKELAK